MRIRVGWIFGDRLTNEGLDRGHLAQVPEQQEERVILFRTQCVLVLQQQLNTHKMKYMFLNTCKIISLYKLT